MDLHTLYRPKDFNELVGQQHLVKALQHFEKLNDWPHAFLLVGESGSGKTTISRIISYKLKADPSNIYQIDAASNSGIDNVRELMSNLKYKAFGSNPTKVYIFDEAHAFSKSAWQALLLPIEEPPEHVYFIFCTTEVDKVPDTIKTRCNVLNFKSIPNDDLIDLITLVSEEEKINLDKKSIVLISRESKGSARRALTFLSMCRGAKNYEEVKEILDSPIDSQDIISFCSLLVNQTPTWSQALEQLKKCEVTNPESVRLILLNYTAKVLVNSKSEEKSKKLLSIIEAFSKPYNQSEKLAPLLLSLGTLLLL